VLLLPQIFWGSNEKIKDREEDSPTYIFIICNYHSQSDAQCNDKFLAVVIVQTFQSVTVNGDIFNFSVCVFRNIFISVYIVIQIVGDQTTLVTIFDFIAFFFLLTIFFEISIFLRVNSRSM